MDYMDLKKLSRTDLLEMLIEQGKELEDVKARLAESETRLQSRDIAIQNAGSIAEASLQLSGIFQAAQEACQQYTENIEKLSGQQEEFCARLEAESMQRAEQILKEAMKKSEKLEADTKFRCAELLHNAKVESKAYWDEVSRRLDQFYEEHKGLREILGMLNQELDV